jgi:hypothetical protein
MSFFAENLKQGSEIEAALAIYLNWKMIWRSASSCYFPIYFLNKVTSQSIIYHVATPLLLYNFTNVSFRLNHMPYLILFGFNFIHVVYKFCSDF